MKKDVIIALDFPNKEKTFEFLDKFNTEDAKPFVKIGMELFYKEGPEIVREIKKRGHKIFLDLKLHDIPNTVEKAMASIASLGVDMTNVHAAGTVEMMRAAKRGLSSIPGNETILIAVTQLTSTSEEIMKKDLLIEKSLKETVLHYGENARQAGLDGVVCSPLESEIIHRHCGKDFFTVTPGIRFEDATKDDQVRITTPSKAAQLGCDFIVVGRPITKAENPVEMYKKCMTDFTGVAKKDNQNQNDLDAEVSRKVAEGLLDIQAVFLRPDEPFTWASGIKSPIYCDNRLILTAPRVRDLVEDAIAEKIEKEFPDCQVLMGTATAGIAHAAIAGNILDLPMGYVRGSAKDHGRTNRIEGRLSAGDKVVVVEDLISTGGSSVDSVDALREVGAEVLGVISIFTYGMKKADERFAKSDVKAVSLANLDTLVDVAVSKGYIEEEAKDRILKFRDNPEDETWMIK